MNEHESWNEQSHAGRHIEPVTDASDDEISLQPLLRSIWSYRRVIGGVVAGVVAAFVVAALVAYAIVPVERMGSLYRQDSYPRLQLHIQLANALLSAFDIRKEQHLSSRVVE